MRLGIVGLPNVGKSTLFNAITEAGAECANYPFCTIEPNVGTVAVPDSRLDVLAKMYNTKKVIPAVLEFVDIAGLVKGASKGEGLGNKFLSHIREVDAIVHVVRCFSDNNITHVENSVDPLRDIEIINTELILADIETVTKAISKLEKQAKSNDKSALEDIDLLKQVFVVLNNNKCARELRLTDIQKAQLKNYFLLTTKPVIYCCNIDETEIGIEDNAYVKVVKEFAKNENAEVLVISCKVEEELTKLPLDERAEFISALGLKESGLTRIVKLGYKLLGQISYLTAGEKEVRAWTITKGTKAPQAAGKIHTDFEKGFIRAEIVSYTDLVTLGSIAAAKEKGKYRSEGKEYVFLDGDVVLFRFNV